MKIVTKLTGWKIKHIKPRKLPVSEIIHVDAHGSNFPTDWRNRILKEK
jgi:hypothetical protein